MRVATWDLAKRLDSAAGVGAAIELLRPDLLLLQSVTQPLLQKLRPALISTKLRWILSSIEEARAAGKHAGNVVAARWPCERVTSGWAGRDPLNRSWVSRYNRMGLERPVWSGFAPRPWLLLRTRLDSPGAPLTSSTRISLRRRATVGNKVKTMSALSMSLESAPAGLRLVGGDFASPRKETVAGIRGYGVGYKGRGELWEEAELGLLGPGARHGLSDAFRALHPVAEAPHEPSCLLEGSGLRRYDHLLASRQFMVQDAEYHREWMDHPRGA